MNEIASRILGLEIPSPVPLEDVPEWGDGLFVRTLGAAELLQWEAKLSSDPDDCAEQARSAARLVVLGVCDESGEPVFEEKNVDTLLPRGAPLLRASRQVLAHNRLSDVAARDLEKN